MSEPEHISTILFRVFKEVERAYEKRQVEIRDLEIRETDASQESQDSFDDI